MNHRVEGAGAGHTGAAAARPSVEPGAAAGGREKVCAARCDDGPACHSWTRSRERPPSYDSWPPGSVAAAHPLPNSAPGARREGASTKTRHAASAGGLEAQAAREPAMEVGL